MSKFDKKNSGLADQKYRPLKKQIKKNFKSLSASIESNKLPAVSLIDDFMAQTKAMVSYSGFGDDRYAVFMSACEALYEAYLQKDPVLFAERMATISSIKKECHHRYK